MQVYEENLKTWYCLECGEVTDEGMEFCSDCDTKFSGEEQCLYSLKVVSIVRIVRLQVMTECLLTLLS